MEVLVLDPAEEAVSRTELEITEWVAEAGPDFGDAAIEQYMAEAARGQIPVDFRVPNRLIQIPLLLRDITGATFEEARAAVQAKAALFQREGGWLKRETAIGPVYATVVGATLKFGGSTWQATRELDPDAVLTLEALPDWYGDEIILGDHSTTTAAELVWVETGIKGDYPGRLRITVDEDDGESQLGLIWAIRCRHLDSASTAGLPYAGNALTPLDAATVFGHGIGHGSLPSSWTPICSTDLSGSPMTHTGTYHVWVSASSSSPVPPQVRIVWDVGDLMLPVENRPKLIPGSNNAYLLDLGEVRLDSAPLGSHRWQGIIQARGAAGGENVFVGRVWLFPVDEGYGVLRAPVSTGPGLAGYLARDSFDQSVGDLNGKTAAVGGTWATSGAAGDLTVETVGHTLQRATQDTLTAGQPVGSGRLAVVGSATYADVVVQADVSISDSTDPNGLLGVLARYVDANNLLAGYVIPHLPGQLASVAVSKRVLGTETVIGSVSNVSLNVVGTSLTVRLRVDTAGRFQLWVFQPGGEPGDPLVVGQDSVLATGGTLDDGKPGIVDESDDANLWVRTYDNFAVWTPSLDAVLYSNQSAELRTDGMFRENAAGTAYGPVSHVVGDLPRIPPSGSEGRPVEFIIKASRGDLDQLPDIGIDDISARVTYRPSWLSVPAS